MSVSLHKVTEFFTFEHGRIYDHMHVAATLKAHADRWVVDPHEFGSTVRLPRWFKSLGARQPLPVSHYVQPTWGRPERHEEPLQALVSVLREAARAAAVYGDYLVVPWASEEHPQGAVVLFWAEEGGWQAEFRPRGLWT